MFRIWKYVVPVDGAAHVISVPAREGRVVQIDSEIHGTVTFWWEHWIDDPDRAVETADIPFLVIGTGMVISDHYKYVGTCRDQTLVWHLYQGKRIG